MPFENTYDLSEEQLNELEEAEELMISYDLGAAEAKLLEMYDQTRDVYRFCLIWDIYTGAIFPNLKQQ